MLQAIAMWGPAMQYSTLRFALDFGCMEPMTCICKRGVTAPDSLRIMNEEDDDSDDEDDEEDSGRLREVYDDPLATFYQSEGGSWADVGYRDDSKVMKESEDHNTGINEMVLRVDLAASNPTDEKGKRAEALALYRMVHELGHVAGLLHERSDAANYVEFVCLNLKSFAKARDKIMASDNSDVKGLNKYKRAEKMCTGYHAAVRYLPKAIDFIPLPPDLYGPTEFSKEYDWLSIMHYPSTADKILGKHYTLVKNYAHGQDLTVWSGGSRDPAKRAISVLDAAKIAELYPLSGGKADQVMKLMDSGWPERKVRIGDFRHAVSPAETPALGKPAQPVHGKGVDQSYALGPWQALNPQGDKPPPTFKELQEQKKVKNFY